MLEARKVDFAYRGGKPILVEVDWSSHPGQVEALVGPNGAGKTTLLRLLSGELAPNSGSVSLDGRSLRQWPIEKLAGRRAMLSQSPRLDFAFTVREVIAMGRAPHREAKAREQDGAIIAAVLEELDLLPLSERPFPSLSRGEKQRVQLARVLAQVDGLPAGPPRHLFLDEPVNHLDLAHQHLTMRHARRRAERGHAVVVVLHDLNLALRYTDRVTLLHAGRIVERGSPLEVFQPDRLRSVFGIEASLLATASGNRVLDIGGVSDATHG